MKPNQPGNSQIIKPPVEALIELGMINLVPPINTPHYIYVGKPDGDPPSNCTHAVEVPIRESMLWCPLCKIDDAPPSYLHRAYTVPHMHQVWHEHFNWTTYQPESDRKKFESNLRRASDRQTERTGIPHSYTRGDVSDYYREAENTPVDKKGRHALDGVPATHDRLVREGKITPTRKTYYS